MAALNLQQMLRMAAQAREHSATVDAEAVLRLREEGSATPKASGGRKRNVRGQSKQARRSIEEKQMDAKALYYNTNGFAKTTDFRLTARVWGQGRSASQKKKKHAGAEPGKDGLRNVF